MYLILICTPVSWFTGSIHWIVDIAAPGSLYRETIVQSSTKAGQIGIVVKVPALFTYL